SRLVYTSRCPLCRLVSEAIHEDYKATHPEDGVAASHLNLVNVFWSRDAGPDCKGAFVMYGVRSCIVCFASDDLNISQATESFCLRAVVASELNYSRIWTWISTCAETHAASCGHGGITPISFDDAYPGLLVLRLIDVEEDRLIEASEILPYAALSYVWGGIATIRLTRANLEKMLQPGSLEEDNSEDLERGVKVMDNIYEQSQLTVIAATGHSAEAGLPGVRGNSRLQTQAVEVKKNTHRGVFVGLDQLLQSTVYQSRAWTFQEQLLCRRALFFVDNQVFFRCRQHTLSERTLQDIRNPQFEMSKHTASQNLTQLSWLEDPVKDYAGILEHCTARALTNQGDAQQALAGTMRRVGQRLGQDVVQGLPSGEMDSFLLFRSASGGGFSSRRRGFPSWSWAGWEQAVTSGYDDIVSNWPESQNWIVCRDGQSYPLLQFWTLTVYYRTRVENAFAGICTMYGNDGSSCGIVRVDGLESDIVSSGDDPWEFILLSEHSDEGQDQGLDAVYTIMLLEKHNGFAERRGLEYCSLSRIPLSYPPGPVWKEIILGWDNTDIERLGLR
ncbi:hypothetical protein CMUS01_14840, partial [Colletotrichum musicola]